jgi:hypothetical protein
VSCNSTAPPDEKIDEGEFIVKTDEDKANLAQFRQVTALLSGDVEFVKLLL